MKNQTVKGLLTTPSVVLCALLWVLLDRYTSPTPPPELRGAIPTEEFRSPDGKIEAQMPERVEQKSISTDWYRAESSWTGTDGTVEFALGWARREKPTEEDMRDFIGSWIEGRKVVHDRYTVQAGVSCFDVVYLNEWPASMNLPADWLQSGARRAVRAYLGSNRIFFSSVETPRGFNHPDVAERAFFDSIGVKFAE